MTDFAGGILLLIAVLGLVFLTLYLPALIVSRLLFHVRRRKGPVMRFLSRPIGPSVPGRGADRSALWHAFRRWAMLGVQAVSLAIASAVIASGGALFGGPAGGWFAIAFVVVLGAALFASVVAGVECVYLLVRLLLHAPRNPTDSLASRENSEPHHHPVNPPGGPRSPFSSARLAAPRAGVV